jgi:hypothetical protein
MREHFGPTPDGGSRSVINGSVDQGNPVPTSPATRVGIHEHSGHKVTMRTCGMPGKPAEQVWP